jgi:hypothetical protein
LQTSLQQTGVLDGNILETHMSLSENTEHEQSKNTAMTALGNNPKAVFGVRERSSNPLRKTMSFEADLNRKPAPRESLGGYVKHDMDQCDHI